MANMTVVQNWLETQGRIHIVRIEDLDNGGRLTWYSLHGFMFILHEYAGGDGWDIYASVSDSISASDTLTALEARIKAYGNRVG